MALGEHGPSVKTVQRCKGYENVDWKAGVGLRGSSALCSVTAAQEKEWDKYLEGKAGVKGDSIFPVTAARRRD